MVKLGLICPACEVSFKSINSEQNSNILKTSSHSKTNSVCIGRAATNKLYTIAHFSRQPSQYKQIGGLAVAGHLQLHM